MKKILRYVLIAALVAGVIFTFVYLWKNQDLRKRFTNWLCLLSVILNRKRLQQGKWNHVTRWLLFPQISGIVSDLSKEAGQMVTVGEIIARIKVIPEMGTLNAAESRVTQSELNLNQAQRIFDRTKELYQAGVVVQEEFENEETRLKLAHEELRNAQDNLEIVRDGIAKRSSAASNTHKYVPPYRG